MQDSQAGPSRGLSAIGPLRDGVEIYRLDLDDATGFVRSTARGFWSLADAEDYFRQLKPLLDESRRRLGGARALLDGRGILLQAPKVAERFTQVGELLYRPEDRVAIIVDSVLLRLQLHRVGLRAGSQTFLSPDEAESWLKTTE